MQKVPGKQGDTYLKWQSCLWRRCLPQSQEEHFMTPARAVLFSLKQRAWLLSDNRRAQLTSIVPLIATFAFARRFCWEPAKRCVSFVTPGVRTKKATILWGGKSVWVISLLHNSVHIFFMGRASARQASKNAIRACNIGCCVSWQSKGMDSGSVFKNHKWSDENVIHTRRRPTRSWRTFPREPTDHRPTCMSETRVWSWLGVTWRTS